MKKQEISAKAEAGFTLIELIMVIVILGILAAVAVPKFTDLSVQARQAAVDNMAGSIAAASTSNLAACAVGNAACVAVTACTNTNMNTLMQSDIPTEYTVSGDTGIADGATGDCTLTHSEGETADFVITGDDGT